MERKTTDFRNKFQHENRLLFLCIICESIAFLLAMLFRYVVLNSFYWNPDRDYDFYKTFFVVVQALYAVIFNLRKKKRPSIRKMNNWEQLIEVLKQHTLLLLCLVLFLYFIHASLKVSRTIMAFLVFFGILLDLGIRIWYAKKLSKRTTSEKAEEVLLICTDTEPHLAWLIERYGYYNEKKGISGNCHIAATVTLSGNNGPSELPEETLKQNYDMIYLSLKAARLLGPDTVRSLEQHNTPICRELTMDGVMLPSATVSSFGGNAAVYRSLLTNKCPVLGVNYSVAGLSEAAVYILTHTKELNGKYICFSNVHTTVMAADNKEYLAILNGSAATFPDGKPVADKIQAQGYGKSERVAGPDLMAELFRCSQSTGRRHYFYGSTEETLSLLKERLSENYPYLEIAGMYSPPFRDLTEEEDAEVVKMINESNADYVWIGLGAPRQEKWMAAHEGRINGIMLGVGAGFNFHAGNIKRAPGILQKLGLEWLYRLFQDPKRLVKRYLITNTKFILYTTFRKTK